MMSPIAQLPSPPRKFDVFMEKFAWPTITLTVGTVLATVIIAITLGKIEVVDFSWTMLILGCLMLGITVFFAWYSIKTKRQLLEQYNKENTNFKKDVLAFKNDIRRMREDETHQWNEWAISFSRASDREQRERSEALKKQFEEQISDAENRVNTHIGNTKSIWTTSVDSLQTALDLHRQGLITIYSRLDEVEEKLKKDLTLENTEQSSESEIPPV